MSQFRQPMNISTPDNIQSNEIYKHEKHNITVQCSQCQC